MSNIKKLAFTALCVAIGIVLPMALHALPDAGRVLLPMHIPVLLCGLICGPRLGAACGVLAPMLSSLFTSMPPAPILPGMMCELAVYGLAAGLLIRYIKTGKIIANLYLSLIGAMLAGRIVGGLVNAFIFMAGKYSLAIWLTGAFAAALPGMAIQLVLIPIVVMALQKAKIIKLS